MIQPIGGSGNSLGELISAQADYTVSLTVQKLAHNSAEDETGDVYNSSRAGGVSASLLETVDEARLIDRQIAALKQSGDTSHEAYEAMLEMNNDIGALLVGNRDDGTASLEDLLSGGNGSLAQALTEIPMDAYSAQANMKTLAVMSLLG